MKLKFKIILLFCLMIIGIQTISFADEPNLNSEAAILVEVSTGRIIYEKNSTFSTIVMLRSYELCSVA